MRHKIFAKRLVKADIGVEDEQDIVSAEWEAEMKNFRE